VRIVQIVPLIAGVPSIPFAAFLEILNILNSVHKSQPCLMSAETEGAVCRCRGTEHCLAYMQNFLAWMRQIGEQAGETAQGEDWIIKCDLLCWPACICK
jgi:hypothetical protein